MFLNRADIVVIIIIVIINAWSAVLLEKLTLSASRRYITLLYAIRIFSTVCTTARHLFLSSASRYQYTTFNLTSRYFLKISSPLDWRFPSGLFSSSFPSKTLHAFSATRCFLHTLSISLRLI